MSLIILLTAHERSQETGAGRVLLSITPQPGADQQKGVLAVCTRTSTAQSYVQINLNSTSRKKGLQHDGLFDILAYALLLSWFGLVSLPQKNSYQPKCLHPHIRRRFLRHCPKKMSIQEAYETLWRSYEIKNQNTAVARHRMEGEEEELIARIKVLIWLRRSVLVTMVSGIKKDYCLSLGGCTLDGFNELLECGCQATDKG